MRLWRFARFAVCPYLCVVAAKIALVCGFRYKTEEKLMFFRKIGMFLENLEYFCIAFQLKVGVRAKNKPNVID